MLRFFMGMMSIATMVPGAGAASAQTASTGAGPTYPNKPIRIVAPEAGGGTDFAARLIAQGLSSSLGQQVIVDNRGGAGGAIAIGIVAKAPADGYTLLCFATNFWLLPFLQDNVSYDPVRDFLPVTLAVTSPNILVVHPSVAADSVKELIALARARPGQLNYGSGATGGTPHLAAELFKAMARVNVARISYKGTASALTGLLGGEVQLMFPTIVSVMPHVKSGRLRALAITTAQPSPVAPDLPTVAASGLPGYESISINSVFAPANTPAAVINRLNQAIVQVLRGPEVKERFLNAGTETVGSTPAQLAATMKSDMARMGRLIKEAGIRAE